MAGKLPYIQFYPGDWLRDNISGCSLSAQGLWLRMMIVAHDSDRYGYLETNGSPMQPETIARRCGCDLAQYETLLSELVNAGVPGSNDQGSLFSRRMVRDANLREIRVNAGRKGGKQKASKHPSKSLAKPKQNPEYEYEDEDEDEINILNLPEVLNNQQFRDAFSEWIKYKRERRESYKPTGLKQVIAEAAKVAKQHGCVAVVDAMQIAASNGWKGWNQKSSFGSANGKQRDNSTVGTASRERSL